MKPTTSISNKWWILSIIFFLPCCSSKDLKKESTQEIKSKDLLDTYSDIKTETMYSVSVSDSFKIFKSIPNDSSEKEYPLILVLDGNAYFESVVAEYKLAILTQSFPKSILIGIGYKDFKTMDSLRDRDYTYPKDSTEHEMNMSGGGLKFKRFIDEELLPKLNKQFSVDKNKTIILGHSLGGYFVLYYMLNSLEAGNFNIKNFIAASPFLGYNNKYLLDLENRLGPNKKELPVKLYVSQGSLDRDTTKTENIFRDFGNQLISRRHNGAKAKFVEYSNFEHMDAAMPGFIKGLIFIFEK